jgi:hypothetical protein
MARPTIFTLASSLPFTRKNAGMSDGGVSSHDSRMRLVYLK